MKDKIQGKGEELKGRMTGDRATELKGKARQATGEAKRLARDLGVGAGGGREPDAGSEAEVEREASRPVRPSDP